MKQLIDANLFSQNQLLSFQELRGLRNRAARSADIDPDFNAALDYIKATEVLRVALKGWPAVLPGIFVAFAIALRRFFVKTLPVAVNSSNREARMDARFRCGS